MKEFFLTIEAGLMKICSENVARTA